MSQRLGIPIANPDLLVPETEQLFHGQITEAEYWQALIKKYDWLITLDELKSIVRENFQEIEGTRKIIEELREKGSRLGLLSVHAKEWIDHCEERFD